MTDKQLKAIAEIAQRADGQPNQTMRDMARELYKRVSPTKADL